MDSKQRTEYLMKRLHHVVPDAGTMNIAYKQTHVTQMGAYKIDLEYLIYNQFNGRIGTLVKAYEAENGEIDVESSEGNKLIEKFLWDSHIDHNKRTMQNLKEVGQRDPGIVTLDGVIIDGNRRALLLAKIAKGRNQPNAYFNAVILPDPMGAANAREIKRLETQYQMGLDEKLGYNAIEKYLQIQGLYDNDFDFPAIAKLMNLAVSDVEKYWDVKQLMDEYLKHLGYEDMYTRLDRAEDWFWKLQESMKRFDLSNGNASTQVQWPYAANDVTDLKLIMFDYIRASREAGDRFLGGGQNFRDICSATKTGFFRHRHIWEAFSKQHFRDFDSVEEKSIDDYRRLNPGVEMTTVLKAKDRDFTKLVEDRVKANFGKTTSNIGTEIEKSEPKTLLENAWSKLDAIDETSKDFERICREDSTIVDLIKSIGNKQFQLKKAVDKIHSNK